MIKVNSYNSVLHCVCMGGGSTTPTETSYNEEIIVVFANGIDLGMVR